MFTEAPANVNNKQVRKITLIVSQAKSKFLKLSVNFEFLQVKMEYILIR